jgi:hypothetical protein
MQHNTPIAVAVGVEVGTSGYTASIAGADGGSTVRRFDIGTDLATVLDEVLASRADTVGGPAAIAFAAPAWWEESRRQELESAAEHAGFDCAAVVSPPEAAAAYAARALGCEPRPGSALAVFDLGANSCEVAVVHPVGERYTVANWANTGAVGGNEYDQLLLAYLSGRYSDTNPEFWRTIDDPVDADAAQLRARLLDEIRLARSQDHLRGKTFRRLEDFDVAKLPVLSEEELDPSLGEHPTYGQRGILFRVGRLRPGAGTRRFRARRLPGRSRLDGRGIAARG